MNIRLVLMIIGSFVCVALVFVSRESLLQATSLFRTDFSSLNALINYAFVFFTTLLPVVCIVSLVRGWLSWAGEGRARALGRLWMWPLATLALTGILYGLGLVIAA